MCTTCGCSDGARPEISMEQHGERSAAGELRDVALEHAHSDAHVHAHAHEAHDHSHGSERHSAHAHTHSHTQHSDAAHSHDQAVTGHVATLRLEQNILAKNDRLAERNRGWFAGRNILALNLVSSPGAGKTALLERTIRDLGSELNISVIEGDQATDNDSRRIRAAGARVVQINTGTGCHLDAEMVSRGLEQLDPPTDSVVIIENVGNLVCPALFDLGEHAKVLVCSVPEGDDKPIKYPHMFRASGVMLLNKIDLLPHVPFDRDRCLANARLINPNLQIYQISATSGDGLTDWYGWLRNRLTSFAN